MMKVSCLIKLNASKSEARRRRTTSGCGGVLAEFAPKSTEGQVEAGLSPIRAGGALAEVLRGRLRQNYGRTRRNRRPQSAWSAFKRSGHRFASGKRVKPTI